MLTACIKARPCWCLLTSRVHSKCSERPSYGPRAAKCKPSADPVDSVFANSRSDLMDSTHCITIRSIATEKALKILCYHRRCLLCIQMAAGEQSLMCSL